ncbi:MAG TPA: hypothetical protein VMI54_12605 [Polyangiaceae bacterium]|nr:hypothetical protein [Polyangiaceae bacterium]
MPAQRSLGDAHNFGRRVRVRGRFVAKPRPVLWEWLLLAAESPLRRVLSGAAADGRVESDAFDFLPSLGFERHAARAGGAVERVRLEPLGRLSARGRAGLARAAGRLLALTSWLGIVDLHWENLALGADRYGRLVFSPLDVEMILGDLALPTETKLIPDADPEYAATNRHAAGLRRVLPYLGKPIRADYLLAMAGAYRGTLELLERHARAIADVFARLPHFGDTPIRVCLRGTDEYVRAASVPPWPPLLEAEREQLARGDVPYFFRRYGAPGIHYYRNRALTELGVLPRRGDAPKLEPLLAVTRGLRSPARQKLRDQGLFALLGAFDHAGLTGRHANDELTVRFGARSLGVRLASGDEFETRRDLSAFVGTIYSPCRCGEVRSALVPSVTRCRAAL